MRRNKIQFRLRSIQAKLLMRNTNFSLSKSVLKFKYKPQHSRGFFFLSFRLYANVAVNMIRLIASANVNNCSYSGASAVCLCHNQLLNVNFSHYSSRTKCVTRLLLSQPLVVVLVLHVCARVRAEMMRRDRKLLMRNIPAASTGPLVCYTTTANAECVNFRQRKSSFSHLT